MSAMTRLALAVRLVAVIGPVAATLRVMAAEQPAPTQKPTSLETAAVEAKAQDGKREAKTSSKPSPIGPPVVAGELGPDDYALRYYAALNQTVRVNAEMSRLHRLYPGYEPPADLYNAPATGGVDEGPLWALYSADRIDDLHAAIAAKQREISGWKPSADLAEKLRRKELRKKVGSFWKNARWRDLVDFVKGEDLTALANDVDILWNIAEAYARAKQTNDAVTTFRQILSNSKDPQIRIATIKKAIACLRMSDVETLLAAAPPGPDGKSEFASIMTDITRARIAAFLHGERAEEIPAAEMAQFEAFARDSRDSSQIGLVAWYAYKRRDFHNALDWFKNAIQNDGDATIAHGLAHTLRALGMMREAEEVAYAWRDPLANNVILFLDLVGADLVREIPPYIEAERLARYARVTMEIGAGDGAQALGWYAYNSCQFDVASFWFEKAVAWYPKEASAQGYAMSLRHHKKNKPFYDLVNRYDGLFPNVVELLFPDGFYHPPRPCDQRGSEKFHGPAFKTVSYVVPGPALLSGAPASYEAAASGFPAPANLSAQLQAMQAQQNAQLGRVLKNIKGKFPVAVAPENPVRARAMGPAPTQRPPAADAPPAPESALAADPARGLSPLVARRVPGVGPMPYERYGFSLLSGWNGVETASWPPASQLPTPAGTVLADQDEAPLREGVAAYDAKHAPRAAAQPVAPPTAATGAPPARPYFAPPPSPRGPSAYGQYPQPMSR